jgi:hypothetical protein
MQPENEFELWRQQIADLLKQQEVARQWMPSQLKYRQPDPPLSLIPHEWHLTDSDKTFLRVQGISPE